MPKFELANRLKIVSIVLLLLSLFLPISSCTTHFDVDEKNADLTEQPVVETVTTDYYVWDEFDLKDSESWIYLFCMLWPVAGLARSRKARQRWERNIRLVVEPLLAISSVLYVFVIINLFSTPSYGSYIMAIAYVVYFIGWILESVTIWRAWRVGVGDNRR